VPKGVVAESRILPGSTRREDRLADRGTIEVGKPADLVLLARDSRQDIRVTRDILWVMQGGKRFDPDSVMRTVIEPDATESYDARLGGSDD
jgi:cytosine/adenosine deaminase-related metal-dependent hydrolase